MRSGLATLLLAAILFGSGYWYYTARAVCDVPVLYRIGSIDERFDLTREEAQAAVSAAESMWEDATGKNLFTRAEEAEFTINFVYDDRQEYANAENNLRDELETKESVSDQTRRQYEELLQNYDELKDLYEQSTAAYEEQLEAHNNEVERWNEAGGAPPDIYENLENRQAELAKEQKELNTIAYELNSLVQKMNAVGAEGNSLITDYNEIVEEYNTRFNENHEFTQGDYKNDEISIYQFDSIDELKIVLAHEFGHALSLDHVSGEESVMYHFMEEQSLESGITSSDLTEFERICGDNNSFRSFLRL